MRPSEWYTDKQQYHKSLTPTEGLLVLIKILDVGQQLTLPPSPLRYFTGPQTKHVSGKGFSLQSVFIYPLPILQGNSHEYLFSLQKLTGLQWKVFDILIKLNVWNICCIFCSARGSPQVYYLPKTLKNGLTLKMDPLFSTDWFDYFK